MDKIIERLNKMALAGDKAADAILMAVDGMNQNELADYVVQHDKELRSLLGVKYLVEKDSNTDLAKSYFDLLNKGREQASPDKGKKQGFYGEELRDVPYFMERFGISKEGGKYSTKAQADFVNAIDKLDDIELANLAWAEGYEGNAERMRDDIRRAGERLQQQFYRSGYSPDGSLSIAGKAKNLASSFLAPRVSEAHQSGANASGADIAGDIAEGALNVVPGLGFLGKMAGKIGSKVPRIAASVGANLAESVAVPLAANAIDVGLYSGTGDPRGEWDPERVLAQTAGTIGIKGAVKAGAGTAKNVLELRAGRDAGGSAFKDAMDIVENIGNSTKENIARRQMAMERKAELARNPQYNSQQILTAKQNKTGYFATTDDLIDAEDFAIRKAEAERLIKNQPDYETMDAQLSGYSKLLGNGPETSYNPSTSTIELKLSNGEVVTIPNIPEALYANMDDQQLASLTNKAILEKHPEYRADPKLIARLRDYGDNDVIFQLPDGRFVKGEPVKNGANGKLYTVSIPGMDAPNMTLLENNGYVSMPTREPVRVKHPDGSERVMTYKPRDYTVRRELAKDQDFDNLISGRAKWEPYRDVAAQFIGNAAAREGWLGTGGNDLMGKRESALWNRQLDQLRPLVQQGTPEYKQQMVDAIMNVMTFGLDDLPDDVFKANPNAYRAIARQLGSSDWKHSSEVGVPDFPTTSY